MKSFTYISALMGVTSAYVFPRGTANHDAGFENADCPTPSDDFWKLSAEVASHEQRKRELIEADPHNETLTARADININTYVHVVATSQKVEDGWVSVRSRTQASMATGGRPIH